MNDIIRSAKQLGTSLRRCRRLNKMTQAQVAKRAGLRQGTVSQIESGLDNVKLSTIMSLLRVLDLELTINTRSKGSHDDIEDMF